LVTNKIITLKKYIYVYIFVSIGHHQPQRPVPRGFPLFKRCEWLVSNRFVSKWRPSYFWYI